MRDEKKRELVVLAGPEDLATKEQRRALAEGLAELLVPAAQAARARMGLPPLK